MSVAVDVEPQRRTRFFPGGFRNPFVRRSPSRHLEPNRNGQIVPVLTAFQSAQHVTLHNSQVYMSPPEQSTPRSSQQSSGAPPTAESSSPSTRAPETPAVRSEISSPSVTQPFPVPETSPQIYVYYLKAQGRGYPLWIPPPSMSLPVSYRSSGVGLGDVGIITPQGGFRFFFNVFHEATHSINAEMELPDNFVPFATRLQSSHFEKVKESSLMSHLSDDSIARTDSEDGFKATFRTSAKQAAVLIMPNAVHHWELRSMNLFRVYVNEHLQGWYYFIRQKLGEDVKNGELRVIYGCRKSTGFGIATVSKSRDPITEVTFSVDVEDADCRYRWRHTSGSAEVKAGPSLDENADIRELDPNAQEPDNQCLFLSSLDFTLSDTQWAQLDSNNPVTSLTRSSEKIMEQAKSGTPPAPSQSGTAPSFTSEVHPGNFTTYGMGMNEEIQLPKRLFNPSDVLGRFLLDIIPDAMCVAICYDDWGSSIAQHINDTFSLIRGVLSANHVCWEDGMIYLIPNLISKSSALLSVHCTEFMDLLARRMNGAQEARYLDLDAVLSHRIIPYQRENHDQVPRPASRAGSELPNIGIGVFDPYQHINNQYTVLITIIDDGTIMTEIKPSKECPPPYVLMIDGINTDHLNVDLDWFLPRTADSQKSVFIPLMGFSTCVGLQLKELVFVDAEHTHSNKTAHEIFATTTTLASLAQILCRLALSSIGFNQTLEIVSHRLPSSLPLLGLHVMTEAPSEDVLKSTPDVVTHCIPAQPLLPAPKQQPAQQPTLIKQSALTKQHTPSNNEGKVPPTHLNKYPTPDRITVSEKTTIRGGAVILNLIQQASKLNALPYLSDAAGLALSLLQIAQTLEDNQDGFQGLVDDSTDLVAVFYRAYQGTEDQENWLTDEAIKHATRDLVQCLNSTQTISKEMNAQRLARGILYHPLDANTIKKCKQMLSSVTTQFQIATGLNVHEVLNQILKQTDEFHAEVQSLSATHASTGTSPQTPDQRAIVNEHRARERIQIEKPDKPNNEPVALGPIVLEPPSHLGTEYLPPWVNSQGRFQGAPSYRPRDTGRAPVMPTIDYRQVSKTLYTELGKYPAVSLPAAPPNYRSNARSKFTRLTIHQFYELSTDVYDELIRRSKVTDVPFLPARSEFHPKRNQARQKLATLPTSRFEDLSGDVFFELARRYPEFKEDPSGGGESPTDTYDDYPPPYYSLWDDMEQSNTNSRASDRVSSDRERPPDSGYGGSISGHTPSIDSRRPSEDLNDGRRSEDAFRPSDDAHSGRSGGEESLAIALASRRKSSQDIGGREARESGMTSIDDRAGDSSRSVGSARSAAGANARIFSERTSANEDTNKIRSDYEYKIAIMQSQINSMQRELSDAAENERRRKESEERMRQMDEELSILRDRCHKLEQENEHRLQIGDSDMVEQLRHNMESLIAEISELSQRNDVLMASKDSDNALIREMDNQLKEYMQKYELAKTELQSVKGMQFS